MPCITLRFIKHDDRHTPAVVYYHKYREWVSLVNLLSGDSGNKTLVVRLNWSMWERGGLGSTSRESKDCRHFVISYLFTCNEGSQGFSTNGIFFKGLKPGKTPLSFFKMSPFLKHFQMIPWGSLVCLINMNVTVKVFNCDVSTSLTIDFDCNMHRYYKKWDLKKWLYL